MTDEINVKKMFECDHCHILFENYDEAVEHEKSCSENKEEEKMKTKTENETVEEKEAIENKETEESGEIKEDDKEQEDEYLNTDIEKELDLANGKEDEEEIEEKIEKAEEKNDEKTEAEKDNKKEIKEKEDTKEEIKKEIIEEMPPEAPKEERTKCTLCGLCKLSCPAYSVLLNEAVSPRGKAIMLKRDIPSKYIYLCTLCKACEEACVLNDIDITKRIVEFRKELVNLGIRTEANERMIDNIRKYGNSIGKIVPGKKVTLWCC